MLSTTRPKDWTLVTHDNPDIDDVEAFRVLMHHGDHMYPGILSAEIMTVRDRKPWDKSAEELERARYLCVGIAGGRFDEHAFDGHPRKSDECAATLVAKHLGVAEHPMLQKNLAYAFDRNQNANSTEFDLALLAKLGFRYQTHSGDVKKDQKMIHKIFQAAIMFLNAAEDNEAALITGDTPQGSVLRSMDDYIAVWLLKTFRPGKPALLESFTTLSRERKFSTSRIVMESLSLLGNPSLTRILAYADLHQSADTGSKETSFELASLVEIAQRHLCKGEATKSVRTKIGDAVGILLTGMWKKEENFHTHCRRDYSANTTRFWAIPKDARTVKVVSVVSNNFEMAKFCRSRDGGKADVVIQQHTSGNTQIFFDQKSKVDPLPIVSAIRAAERRANGYHDVLSFEALTAEGEVPGADAWYFDGHQLMNGSLTTDRPPTKLGRDFIERMVKAAVK